MIEVYKYGGNILKDETSRKRIYEFLKSKIEQKIKIIMVVSAFGREKESFSTDNLSKNIELLTDREKDSIMTFGEIYSSLIIKNELLKEKIKVECLGYDEIGILCDNNYQNGNIKKIDMEYLKETVEKYDVVIVPGFIAESSEGRVISLGRNTSDLTAVVIAHYLKIKKVNIIKEVDGVFKKDPKKGKSKIMKQISYDEMNSLIKAGSNMFSKKTIDYAKDNNVEIEVKGLGKEDGTMISKEKSKENILFMNKENNQIKVVFKDMNIFNEIYKQIVEDKIKLEELIIMNNVFYLKGNEEKLISVVDKYL